MKFAGLLLLVAAGGGIGWLRAAALHRRAAALETARRLVLWLTAQVQYTAAPVGDLLRQAAASEEFSAFSLPKTVVCEMRQHPFPIAWKQAATIAAKENNFTEKDGDLLRCFGEGFGKTDRAGQVAHGELFAALFLERQQQAAKVAHERGRVECVLWPSGAAVLALLLL